MSAKITKRFTLGNSSVQVLLEIVLNGGERIICQIDATTAGRFLVIVKQQQLPRAVLDAQHRLQPNTPIGVCKEESGGLEFLETGQPVALSYNTDDGQYHTMDAGRIADLHILPTPPLMR